MGLLSPTLPHEHGVREMTWLILTQSLDPHSPN